MLSARIIVQSLLSQGITHVVGIPENATAELHRELARQEAIRNLVVTREGEAFAMAAGLWIGGRNPLVLIQNTGLLESGDSLRGTLVRMRIPVLSLISCRGYSRLPERFRAGLSDPPRPEDLANSEIDSVSLVTEPTLRAWGIPYWKLDSEAALPCIGQACAWSREHLHPGALLLESVLSGEEPA